MRPSSHPARADYRAQHLERDFAIVLEVAGQVDGRHSARADLTLDGVAVGEG